MNKQQYEVNNLPTQIVIGHQTETGVTSIYFDCTSWLASWPDLVLGVWVTQPGGTAAYPAATHMEGDVLVWDVTDSDTAVPGTGTMEIVGITTGKKKLSAIAKTKIMPTTTGTTTTPPEGEKAWVDAVIQAAGDAETSKSQAATYAQNAAASAEKAEENAKSVTWETLSGKPSTFPPDSHTHTLESLGAATAEEVSKLKDDLAAEQTARKSADAALASDIANLLDQNYVGIAEKQANAVINEDGTIGTAALTDVYTVRISSLYTSVTVYNRVTTGGSTYRMGSLLAFYDAIGTLVKYISGNGYAQGVQTFDIPSGATVIKVCQSNQSADADSICIRFKYNIGHVAERELNYCALGDSITSGMGVNGKSYAYYTSEILRLIRFDNIAVPGKPMIGWGEIQYENVPTDTDVFTCMMGTNDWNLNYSVASFKSKYESLITNLIARCPKIKIFLITTLHRDYTGGNGALSGETNTNGVELAVYNEAVKEIGVKYGLPVIDLYSTSGISALTFDTYTQDRLHPNEDGHKRIAKIVSSEIEKYIE